MEKKNSFIMHGSILAIAAMITKVIGLAYRIPLTNILGEEGNGYYGVVFQVYNLALMLTSYSLPMAVSKLVSARLVRKEYKNVQQVFKGALVFALIAGGAATLIVFFGAQFIASSIMKMSLSVYGLRTLSPCILIVAFLGVLRGYFQGHQTMIPTAVSQVIEQIMNAIVSVVGAYLLFQTGLNMATDAQRTSYGAAMGAAGATLGTTFGALLALLFLVLIYVGYKNTVSRRVAHDRTIQVESPKHVYKILFLTIAPVILSATISNVTNILDQGIFTNIMAAQGHTEREYVSLLGVFNGQYDTMMGIPLSVATALAASFMPSLVAVLQTGRRKDIHRQINTVSKLNMMIVIPCVSGFIFLARPILDLLFFTQDNTIPAMLLRIGGISAVFFCLCTVTNAALQGLDRMKRPVINAAIALGVHIVVLVIMMVGFKWNIYAVVISKIVFAGVICILNARDLYKACGYVQEVKKTFIIPSICALIMGVLSMGIQFLLNLFLPSAVATILAIIMAVAIYGVTMIIFGGIESSELQRFPMGGSLVRFLKKTGMMR